MRPFIAALATLALCIPVIGQLSPEVREELRETFGRFVEDQDLVGASLAIADDGTVALEVHLGFQDREKSIETSRDTMYRWASISKPVTAIVALQLAEEGKLSLDADIRELVPEFPEKPHVITARQLLCHQGGVVHYRNGPVVMSPNVDKPHPFKSPVDALTRFKESPLVAEPGTSYNYTTHGYILLGAVVERAGGAAYQDLVHERVARRAGMTTFQPDYHWERIDDRAVGYRRSRDGEIKRSTNTDVSWKLPGGGYISTVGDLSSFSIAFMDGRLLDDASRDAMCTRQMTSDGTETRYGLGLTVDERHGQPMVYHTGSQEKVRAMLLMFPEEQLSFAIMTNSEYAKVKPIAYGLAEVVLAEPATVAD